MEKCRANAKVLVEAMGKCRDNAKDFAKAMGMVMLRWTLAISEIHLPLPRG
jgi:hypothetical protein